jgi:predicted RNA-binding Zn-ribbon protein involved in translation (DUF1610 family)
MESKNRIKLNWFITSDKKETSRYCPECGGLMEKVLHTPKKKPPIYQCLKCNKYSQDYHFDISDLK